MANRLVTPPTKTPCAAPWLSGASLWVSPVDKSCTAPSLHRRIRIRDKQSVWCFSGLEDFFFTILDFSFLDMNFSAGNNCGELLLVCDHSLFLLKAESGGLIQQKRLERGDASCACAYPIVTGEKDSSVWHNIVMATQDKMIQVYSAFNLSMKILLFPNQSLNIVKIFYLIFFVSQYGQQRLTACLFSSLLPISAGRKVS